MLSQCNKMYYHNSHSYIMSCALSNSILSDFYPQDKIVTRKLDLDWLANQIIAQTKPIKALNSASIRHPRIQNLFDLRFEPFIVYLINFGMANSFA